MARRPEELLVIGVKVPGRAGGLELNVKAIVLTDSQVSAVRKSMRRKKVESLAFLFGKVKGDKLLTTDVLIPRKRDYAERTAHSVEIKPDYIARKFPKLIGQEKTLIATVHSHKVPMEQPSFGDIQFTHKSVQRVFPHHLTGIFCRNELRFFALRNGKIVEVEKRVVQEKLINNADRQVRFLGREGQLLLSSTKVLLIGCGGGNAIIAFALACMRVKQIILIDYDKWEETNRNRVFIPRSHVGKYKVASMKKLIQRHFPEVEVDGFVARAQDLPEEIYAIPDILIIGPDTDSARIFGNRMALKYKKPAIFPAAGILGENEKLKAMVGSVQVVIPDETPCYECVAEIDPKELLRETTTPTQKKYLAKRYMLKELLDMPIAPSIISLNYAVAGIALWEFVKLVTGIERNKEFQVIDLLRGELREIKVKKDERCPACSEIDVKFAEEGVDREEILSYAEKI